MSATKDTQEHITATMASTEDTQEHTTATLTATEDTHEDATDTVAPTEDTHEDDTDTAAATEDTDEDDTDPVAPTEDTHFKVYFAAYAAPWWANHAIYIDTKEEVGGEKGGMLYRVVGSVKTGMMFVAEKKPFPLNDVPHHLKDCGGFLVKPVGWVAKEDLDDVKEVCSVVPPPRKQWNGMGWTRMYPGVRIRHGQNWVGEALATLRDAMVLEPLDPEDDEPEQVRLDRTKTFPKIENHPETEDADLGETEDEYSWEEEDEYSWEAEDEYCWGAEDEYSWEAESENSWEVEDESAQEAEDEDEWFTYKVEDESAQEAEDKNTQEVEDENSQEAEDEWFTWETEYPWEVEDESAQEAEDENAQEAEDENSREAKEKYSWEEADESSTIW